MADVSTTLKDPLPGDGGDTENVQRSVGNLPTNGAVRWIGVPAQLQYGCTVGDHHNPLPCPGSSTIISVEPNASELRTAMSRYLQAAAQCECVT